MRISGGVARGIPLNVPKGDAVRPATDGLRQAVFSSLAARVAGARFLDLFAGSGAYGLEALSRGAESGVFVEKNPKATGCLRENLSAVGKCLGWPARDGGRATIIQADALTWTPGPDTPVADLVFIDPPYDLIEEVNAKLFARLTPWLAAKEDPVIVFEMPGVLTLDPAGWTCVKRLGKGGRQPTAAFFRRAG